MCVSHPLPKAVLALCKAVQMSVCPQKGEGVVSCLGHCQRASAHLHISVCQSHNNTWLHKVHTHSLLRSMTHLQHGQHVTHKHSSQITLMRTITVKF